MQPLQISALAVENKLQHLCAEQLEPVGSKLKKSTLNTFVFFTLAALDYTSLQSAFIFSLFLFSSRGKVCWWRSFGARAVFVWLNSLTAFWPGRQGWAAVKILLHSSYPAIKHRKIPHYQTTTFLPVASEAIVLQYICLLKLAQTMQHCICVLIKMIWYLFSTLEKLYLSENLYAGAD